MSFPQEHAEAAEEMSRLFRHLRALTSKGGPALMLRKSNGEAGRGTTGSFVSFVAFYEKAEGVGTRSR